MKKKVYILDTSAILSGKPINLSDAKLIIPPKVSEEITPGGKDYQILQILKEKGLIINSPSKKSLDTIEKISIKTGDYTRLSPTDKELLALALDLHNQQHNEVIIITDDYSIQNVAQDIHIAYRGISQKGITKRLKWGIRCQGCGKQFKEPTQTCPICGKKTKSIIIKGRNIDK